MGKMCDASGLVKRTSEEVMDNNCSSTASSFISTKPKEKTTASYVCLTCDIYFVSHFEDLFVV